MKIFNDGERTGVKLSAEAAEKKLRQTLPVEDFIPISTIKSFFSRLAKKGRSGNLDPDDAEDAEHVDTVEEVNLNDEEGWF